MDGERDPALELLCEPDAFWGEVSPVPESSTPGYELTENASGRFAIDADTGVINLVNPETARAEWGSVHAVRVRVRDFGGDEYEAAFHLRITDRLPMPVLADGTD